MPRILLVDTSRGGQIASELAEVLAVAPELRVVFRELGEPEGAPEEAPAAAPLPDLILAALAPELLARPRELMAALRRQAPDTPVIAAFEGGTPEQVLQLLELGVHDFIAPPLKAWSVLPRLWRLLAREPGETPLRELKQRLGLRHLVGESASFKEALGKLRLIARCDAGVLIQGETGTGKELFARAIHHLGARAGKPFVPVHCGAIPTELIENELFGHERAAYTGAAQSKSGLIQEAEGGTLLLDEIDCLPLLAQVKLLRFLQEKDFRPLGSTRLVKGDVRVIAAANGDLREAVDRRAFRQDLYYRLNVIPLPLPALRERRDDIPLLAEHFLARFSAAHGQPPARFSPAALQALLAHDWPGNVRELQHTVERAVVLSQGSPVIGAERVLAPGAEAGSTPDGLKQAKAKAVARFEAGYIRDMLRLHEGNISRAARAAGKNRRAFFELIRKHRIDVQPFRQPRPAADRP